jgi:hypothetical protein
LTRLFGEGVVPLVGAVAAAMLLVTFWYLLPLLLRREVRADRSRYGIP